MLTDPPHTGRIADANEKHHGSLLSADRVAQHLCRDWQGYDVYNGAATTSDYFDGLPQRFLQVYGLFYSEGGRTARRGSNIGQTRTRTYVYPVPVVALGRAVGVDE